MLYINKLKLLKRNEVQIKPGSLGPHTYGFSCIIMQILNKHYLKMLSTQNLWAMSVSGTEKPPFPVCSVQLCAWSVQQWTRWQWNLRVLLCIHRPPLRQAYVPPVSSVPHQVKEAQVYAFHTVQASAQPRGMLFCAPFIQPWAHQGLYRTGR